MACDVEYTDAFEGWWTLLTAEEQESVDTYVRMLEAKGVALGSPYSSDIRGSKHGHTASFGSNTGESLIESSMRSTRGERRCCSSADASQAMTVFTRSTSGRPIASTTRTWKRSAKKPRTLPSALAESPVSTRIIDPWPSRSRP